MKHPLLKTAIAIAMLFTFTNVEAQSASFTLTQAPCNNNGILTANFTGLTTPLTVTWYVGQNQPVVHSGVTTMSDVLNNYSGAPVWIWVVDAANNVAQQSYAGAPPFNYSVTTSPAICPASGSASATVTGGASSYTYQWYDVATNNTVSISNPANLPAGNYGVTITDANGCVYGSQAKGDSIWVSYQSGMSFNIATTPANCTNGTATVGTITGGTTPYSYLWSNSATTASISNLTMGNYHVAVTDAQGCTETVYTYIQQSKTIGANVTPTPATCIQNNGAAIVFGSGGVPPYSYQWGTGATTQSISGLVAGPYSVKVTDANGCIGNGSAYVSASTPITVTSSATASSCTTPSGSASISISGGTTPYSIQWYTFPAQATATASNLPAGHYSFKVTDVNGCVRTGTVVVPSASTLSISTSASSATCAQSNGSASVTASGGSTPYSYLWSTGGTGTSISNVSAGGYSVTVTDNVGCKKTKSAYVSLYSPVNIALSSTPTSCIYTSTGVATANAWGGTPPYSYQWSNGGSTPAITSLATGNYSVTVTDANGCKDYAYTNVGYNTANNSCYCIITGTVYHDANNNCVQDAGEQGIPNIQIHCSGFGYAYTNANGVYSFKVPTGSYTISETVLGMYPLASCQNNSILVNVTAAPNCVSTVNFANAVNPIHDMHISTWNYTCPVPGYTYQQKVIISNMGTVPESAIEAGYLTDGQILTPTFSPGGKFTGSGNYYQIPNGNLSLTPGASQPFTASYSVPANIPLSTSLVFKDSVVHAAPMSNWLNDYSPWNNVDYYSPVTVGSYDPNFKEVSPKGLGPKGEINHSDSVLEYMVHFQNLGTYKAQNIYILDSLDVDLDWESLRPVYKSHPCEITMSENGVVRFQFDNIDLPAKMNDEVGSNGMVTFTIRTKKNLPYGTEFTNSAAIYFDFNEPVITNTTINTLAPVSVKETAGVSGRSVKVYPNPADDIITVKMENDIYTSVRIMNTMGQTCKTQTLTDKVAQVNIQSLTPGIYFMYFNGPNGSAVEKIEKR